MTCQACCIHNSRKIRCEKNANVHKKATAAFACNVISFHPGTLFSRTLSNHNYVRITIVHRFQFNQKQKHCRMHLWLFVCCCAVVIFGQTAKKWHIHLQIHGLTVQFIFELVLLPLKFATRVHCPLYKCA